MAADTPDAWILGSVAGSLDRPHIHLLPQVLYLNFIFYEKKLAPFRRIGTGLRTKFKGTEVPRVLVLRTDLRHGEREPAVTTPPDVRPAVARAEPATIAATARAQQARTAAGVVNGFVHGNDVPQTHGFDLLVRELLTDEASQFGVRLRELALVGLGANLLRDPVVVLEEHALENGDFGRHAARRFEVRRTEHLLGVVSDAETVAFQTLDPVLAGRAVAGDREVDDAIFLAPRTGRFGNREFVAEKTERHVVATEFLDDGVELASGEAGGCEFCAHDCISLG